jgi:hypothetical protein
MATKRKRQPTQQPTLAPDSAPQPPPPSAKLNFGKYRDMTVAEVAQIDLGYLQWASRAHAGSDVVRREIAATIRRRRASLGKPPGRLPHPAADAARVGDNLYTVAGWLDDLAAELAGVEADSPPNIDRTRATVEKCSKFLRSIAGGACGELRPELVARLRRYAVKLVPSLN